jgi:pimeloyl-ACP methyl ester carboxylesterase
VDVITHSMGGLVLRSFLAARPDAYQRLVRKWIAIASPFGGTPGFGMDALMTGVQFCQVRRALASPLSRPQGSAVCQIFFYHKLRHQIAMLLT